MREQPAPGPWLAAGALALAAGALATLPGLTADLSPASIFMPHGMCFIWRPDVLALHVLSDAAIAASYMGIAALLVRLAVRRRGEFATLPIWLVLAFGAFIFCCGLTHLMSIVVIWTPLYWAEGGLKALTAAASVGTLVGLLLTDSPVRAMLDAARDHGRLLADERAAVGVLQDALATRDTDLTLLTAEIARQREERARILTRYRAIARHFPGGVALFDADLRYTLTEGALPDADGQAPAREGDPVPPGPLREHAAACLLGAPQSYEQQGPAGVHAIQIVPIYDDGEGRPSGGLVVTTDVTRQRAILAELNASEQRFRLLYSASPAALLTTRREDGLVLDANPALERLVGRAHGELIGRRTIDLDLWPDPRDRDEVVAEMRRLGRIDGMSQRIRGPGGELRDVIISIEPIAPIEAGGADALITAMIDVTAQRRAEAALKETERRYRLIADNATDLISVLALSGDRRRLYASPSYRTVLGLDPDDLTGARGQETVHPDDYPLVMLQMRDLELRGACRATYRLRHAGGGWRWIEAEGSAFVEDGQRLAIVVGRDVTERRLIEQQYLQAQKMETVGRLAGAVAHDFNNVLTAILGTAELARYDVTSESSRADLDDIIAASRRAMTVTRQLLSFARRPMLDLGPLDLAQLVDEAVRMLGRLVGPGIQLAAEHESGLGWVHADAGQVEQVIYNLVINARDAMLHGGRLAISTAGVLVGEGSPWLTSELTPGPYVRLRVADTGLGMAPETLEHVFEPFYTTKERGKGTGLGLTTCYTIVRQLKGAIRIESEEGRGTTVDVLLPRVDAPLDQEAADGEALPRGAETVLVAEDDAQVRALAVRVLTMLGYAVLAAEDGAAALELVERHPGRIDLLLTDVMMPRLGGPALAEEFLARAPAGRVLYISGFSDAALPEGPRRALLPKPFAPAQLAQRVRRALDEPRT